MKTLHNTLRVVLIDPPREFDGMMDVEPMLESKNGPKPGVQENGGTVFESSYTYLPTLRGPELKREKDGRYFVYIGWYGTKDGARTRFRRLKVHLDRVPIIIWDCEVTVAGRAPDGSPACATARVLDARNLEPEISQAGVEPNA